jgi:hypothetical protein
MTETQEEYRRRVEDVDNKFHEQVSKRSENHRTRAFEYEKLAADFANKGFQSLTYLNGGALVAIPTAMAFFKADVGKADILWTAGAFIVGLFCVVLAQVAAFFVMSKRSESAMLMWSGQWQQVYANQYPVGHEIRTTREANAKTDSENAARRTVHSNVARQIGLLFFGLSLIAFVAGCVFGGWTVFMAKPMQ